MLGWYIFVKNLTFGGLIGYSSGKNSSNLNTPSGVRITPRLPAHWQKVVVPYKFAKNSYEITVEKAGVTLRVLEQHGPHPEFLVQGQTALPVQ